ncbi:hypothetical protein OIU77_031445 [Salix suchowensis]|uniref:Serine-rich protein-like protein n=1 Tax=Salix suchowensis TaxID=1278906 RepID=A0ABQ9BHM8_9ROSI|nr:hypothetical protein OIU77_031445 [Salix suchowensis]
MAASSSSQSKRSSGPVLRSLSPGGRLQTHHNYSLSSSSSASAFASSTSSSFYSSPSAFFQNSHQRSASPTRVNLYSSSPPLSPSFRFSIDRSTSPNRSISVSKKNHSHPISAPKRTCMCSPTTHRGSFRCSLHKNSPVSSNPAMFTPHRLNMRRSAMTNSLVRIGGVEGEWVKRALTALIRPSSHQQRRRGAFQPRSSRTVSDRRGGHCCIDLDELGADVLFAVVYHRSVHPLHWFITRRPLRVPLPFISCVVFELRYGFAVAFLPRLQKIWRLES